MRHQIQKAWRKAGFVLLLLSLSSGSMWAFGSLNTRPVMVAGDSLQNTLDQIFGTCPGGPCVSATGNQSVEGMWHTSTIQNPTATAVLQFTDVPSGDTFGIWTNPSQLVPILYGTATTTDPSGFSTAATLQWSSSGALRIASPAGDCAVINCTMVTDIQSGSFGFYLQTPTGTYYTVDALNPDGAAQALTYNYQDEWVVAFNGAPVTSSAPGSYDDFVVGIQSISELPEPRSTLLLGSTLPVLAFLRWRRSSFRQKA